MEPEPEPFEPRASISGFGELGRSCKETSDSILRSHFGPAFAEFEDSLRALGEAAEPGERWRRCAELLAVAHARETDAPRAAK